MRVPSARQTSPVTHLLVRCGQYDLALDREPILELIPHPRVAPVPGIAPWLSGWLDTSSQAAAPALDLNQLLGLDVASADRAAVIIRNPAPASRFETVGLLVERLADTVRISPHEIRPLRANSTLQFRNCISAAWRGRSRPCYLLRLEALLPKDLDQHFAALCFR